MFSAWRWWQFSLNKDPDRLTDQSFITCTAPFHRSVNFLFAISVKPFFLPLPHQWNSFFCLFHISETILSSLPNQWNMSFNQFAISISSATILESLSQLLMSLWISWQPLKSLTSSSNNSQLCFRQRSCWVEVKELIARVFYLMTYWDFKFSWIGFETFCDAYFCRYLTTPASLLVNACLVVRAPDIQLSKTSLKN